MKLGYPAVPSSSPRVPRASRPRGFIVPSIDDPDLGQASSRVSRTTEHGSRAIVVGYGLAISWKDLGHKTLEALDYSASPRRTQGELWNMVRHQCREQGVIGLYYDECQHAFTSGPKSNEKLLDRFKALMKEPEWPLMLILSGVPVLASHVNSEEQIAHLLSHVHFDEMHLGRSADPTRDPDMIELNKLVYTYAERAEVDVDNLVDVDFLQRLDFACASRWGLVIELLIRAFGLCRLHGQKTATTKMFSEAYAQNSRLPQGLCPFTAPDYRNIIDGDKLMEMMLDE